MKSHKILKSLAGLTACLSALGTHGSAFAAKSDSSTQSNTNVTMNTATNKNNGEKNSKLLKKEPPITRIGNTLLSRFEEDVAGARVKYDRKTEQLSIVMPMSSRGEPLVITKEGIQTKKDLAKKVCQEALKKELNTYIKHLGTKSFVEATDNDFSDWKFLQPKEAASKMRESYEYTIQMRRKLGQEFRDLEKKLPKDELGMFVDNIIKENRLLDVEFPPDFYRLVERNSRGSRLQSNDFESNEFYE